MTPEQADFEDEVRRIARELWPSAQFGGAAVVEGRERDGIFEADEFIHCIEATVSRALDKAVDDGAKLEKLIKRLGPKHATKFIRGWFITQHEPTADQRNAIAKYQGRIVAVSFDQFRSKLVDARSYLTLREKYPFGSVRDPSTGVALYDLQYVPLGIVDGQGGSYSVEDLAARVEAGGRITLTGDFGAGKSSTARQVFLAMAKRFWEKKTTMFPVMLNLRDHHGQTDPVEVLERHARNIGFPSPSSLVRGWRAGYLHLILDGFDEVASAGWAGQTKRLKDLRHRSMELIRHLQRDTPPRAGLLLTGRAHFFDSDREMGQALALSHHYLNLHLAEFSPEQVAAFLARFGWRSGVPEWLPTRPLLLAYLASKGLLDPRALGDTPMSPAEGWDHLLYRIAEREAEIEAGIDSATVRRLIETLASFARHSFDGLGPLTPDHIQHAFRLVCGYAPDDRGAVLLQRLPGLGAASTEDGSRVFIDRDFADAARAGDVFRFIEDPFHLELDAEEWQMTLGTLGTEVLAFRCDTDEYDSGKISIALSRADSVRFNALGTDLASLLALQGYSYDEGRVFLKEVVVDTLLIDERAKLGNIEFQDCVFSRLDLPQDIPDKHVPHFRRCHFALIAGRTGLPDLPAGRFEGSEIEEFELAAATSSALLALPLPLVCTVLLTILKKVFAQKGAGRKEGALFRGLDTKAQSLVPDVLELLKREGFAVRTRQGTETIWMPSKSPSHRSRALAILAAPMATNDLLMRRAREIG